MIGPRRQATATIGRWVEQKSYKGFKTPLVDFDFFGISRENSDYFTPVPEDRTVLE